MKQKQVQQQPQPNQVKQPLSLPMQPAQPLSLMAAANAKPLPLSPKNGPASPKNKQIVGNEEGAGGGSDNNNDEEDDDGLYDGNVTTAPGMRLQV